MKILARLERADRLHQLAVVVGREVAAAQAVRVDPRLGGEQADEQLLRRHLQAEEADRHRPLAVERDVLGDVQHEAGLAHRRPRRDDHHVARLQAGRHLVQLGEPGRHARDQAAVLLQLAERVEAPLHQVGDRDEAGADALVGDLEDALLGAVEDLVGVLGAGVGFLQDVVRAGDQRAQRRLLLDDRRVVLDVGRARHAVDEARDVGDAADVLELRRPRQRFLQRDQVDGVAALVELDHRLEDAAVRVAVEVAGVDDRRGVVERVVAEQDAAEHRALGVEVVRRRAIAAIGGGAIGAIGPVIPVGEVRSDGTESAIDGEPGGWSRESPTNDDEVSRLRDATPRMWRGRTTPESFAARV